MSVRPRSCLFTWLTAVLLGLLLLGCSNSPQPGLVLLPVNVGERLRPDGPTTRLVDLERAQGLDV
ncbi:hypothetical protein ACNFBT_09775 [Pseudomonas sp. NY15181]|uniref:hypothetical protein n=1 Tax=Pseudomonas sp. NY15181 TaxID=3400349 RepID=UPI003A895BF2